MSASTTQQIAIGLELGLLFSGLWLLWRIVLSPSARAARKPSVLGPWEISLTDFFLFLWCVIIGAIVGQVGASQLLKRFALDADRVVIFASAAFQLGMLAGMGAFRLLVHRPSPKAPLVTLHPAISGIATFLISIPVLAVVALVWHALLEFCGLPTDKQESIDLFANIKTPGLLIFMSVLATVIAPITEELLFRAGIFRFARTRIPRWAALLFPSCVFGALHSNLASFAPLLALGIVFSLAYERTGRIGTTMVAHALFNLNTIVIILSGANI